MFDFLIRNAKVLDGSGGAAFVADIAVKDGRIAAIGKLTGEAARVIDADDLVAAPGFIDIHSHTDAALFIDGTAESKITQGITTEVCGNCGFSSAPTLDDSSRAELDSWRAKHGIEENWTTLDEMLTAMGKRRIAVNFATLVGHSNLRTAVVGLANREASPRELDEMKALLAEALDQGAFGLSSGLIYPPSCYATPDELIELARVVAKYDAVYSTHMRNEHNGLVDSVEDNINLARQSGARVQISHHKACDKPNWGRVNMTLAMIRECRDIGMDITADQYPYIASSTTLAVVLPEWSYDGGDEACLARVINQRDELLDYLRKSAEKGGSIANGGGWETVLISSIASEKNRRYEGMYLDQIAKERGCSCEETALDLLTEEKLSVSMVHFVMCEEDVIAVMRSDATMVGTDASARTLSGELSRGKPHPRAFGTFPRILGKYVREQEVIPLETAIRKMTSMPAKKLGLRDRGILREGNWADIVLFNPNTVIDTATYEHPHQIAKGIDYVFVNGRLSVEMGVLTGEMAGQVLRRD